MAHRAPSAPSDPVMPPPPRRIGVLALQGAVREHAEAIRDVGAEPVLPDSLRRRTVSKAALERGTLRVVFAGQPAATKTSPKAAAP